MSVEAIMWAKRTRAGSANRKLVLLVLADYADEAWSCFPGQALIAEQTELGQRTVRRLLAEMEADGLLRREHRQRPDGFRTSDRIVLAGAPERVENPTGQPCTPTGQPRQSNRPQVAAQEPTVEPQVEPTGPPLPPTGQLDLIDRPIQQSDETLTLVGFDAFWRAFPKKVGKPSAKRAWARAIRRAAPAVIIAAAEAYAADPNREDAYTKYPAPWLNDNRWEAGPLSAKRPQSNGPRSAMGKTVAGFRGIAENARAQRQALEAPR